MATVIAFAVVALPCTMLAWFALEVFAGLRPDRSAPPSDEIPCTFAVIVPAHDEELLIEGTLARLLEVVPATAILVVADNCADRTAELARAAGVRVVERRDPERRGKGYALAFARGALCDAPVDAVMVLDADCAVSRGHPGSLCGRAVRERCAVQAENLQEASPRSSPLVRIGAFAFFVMNVIRAKGLERLGGSALLQGTGMALPWRTFAELELASGDTVEDLSMSVELARKGVPVRLDPRCAVTSQSGSVPGHLEQRRRWEQGFLATGMTHGIPLLGAGIAGGKRPMAAIGAHLLVPPLALLFLLAGLALAISIAMHAIAGASLLPAAITGSLWAIAGMSVLAAWLWRGRDIVPLTTLAAAPLYVAWKLPMYLGLGQACGRQWNRGERVKAGDRTDDP